MEERLVLLATKMEKIQGGVKLRLLITPFTRLGALEGALATAVCIGVERDTPPPAPPKL